MPAFALSFFNEPEHETPCRTTTIEAANGEEAASAAQAAMRDDEKLVMVDEHTASGRRNMRTLGRPEN